jgi:predicted nucleic acid-binding protein
MSVSRAEIALGIELLPAGQKKQRLRQAAMGMFEEEFSGRSLPFDDRAADQYAVIVKQRRSQGLPISVEDAQIAAIALVHQLVLATRNVSDFTGIDGLVVNNPWDVV